MTQNPVGWFEIYVKDMERQKKFYEAVFLYKLEKLNSGDLEMWAFPMSPSAGGAGGALVYMPGFPLKGSNNIVVYFSCEDCAVELSRVTPNGGTIQKPKFSIGEYGFIALALDPEGNMFGLHSRK